MTCKTSTCEAHATHNVDNRGKVVRPTYSAPEYCLAHAAGAAAYRIIRPALNPRFTVTDPGPHARSVGGHKSQKGF
jgi:hypothetical protein